MKRIIFILTLVILALLLAYAAYSGTQNKNEITNNLLPNSYSTTTEEKSIDVNNVQSDIKKIDKNDMNTILLKTTKGDIELELSSDKPVTTDNFKKLVSEGFYDGIKFHRVIKDFMIQAGDPNSKDDSKKSIWGTGGPGYKFNDELTGTEKYPQGTLAMANAGPNTNGSQFFIVTATSAPLPPAYTVFGKVTSGLNTILAIEKVDTDASDKPLEDITIVKAQIK